jgi:proteasome lid subunit RPN8/RPN11
MMIRCPLDAIDTTLIHLREAGLRSQECVVLWLGQRQSGVINVVECCRPLQFARADLFRTPPEGMTALQKRLRDGRLMVAAQVHSHPNEAFHSEADNAWAIVRHEGALSLVVPRFASDIYSKAFLDQTKVFRFSNAATWDEISRLQVTQSCLQIY